MQDVKRTVKLSSDVTQGCDHCDEMLGEGVTGSINHFIEVHGYRLLNVGTETSRDRDGNIRHTTVAILGQSFEERQVRQGLERCLRGIAHDSDYAAKIQLVDEANRVRPRTWF